MHPPAAATNRTRTRAAQLLGAALLCAIASVCRAGVLPEERADVMWKMYEGGGLKVQGPSVLVRKNYADKLSVTAGYLVDQVTGASIDMIVSHASPLREARKQKTLGVDYLYGKTTYSVGVESSIENDYDSSAVHVAIAEDMFGDLTTVTLGASRGWDKVTRISDSALHKDPNFHERLDRKTWSLAVSQILTRNLIGGVDYEAITEQGYLQNPYRSIRYLRLPGLAAAAPEIFPGTRTTNAIAPRLKYYLPWRASLTGKYRYFFDTWEIRAHTAELIYTQPLFRDSLITDVSYRHYRQTAASFYSDLFQFANQQNYMARDRELAAQHNNSVGIAFSYDFVKSRHWLVKKASASLHYDYIMYRYDNFRDASQIQYAPGSEPLYHYNASVIQAFVSVLY
jgi:hypothetical protein